MTRTRGFAVPNLLGVKSNQAFHLTLKEWILLGDMHSNYWTHPAFWNSWLQLLTDMLFCSFIHWKYCIKEHFLSTKSSVSTLKTYRACQYNDHHYCCLYEAMAKSRIYNFLWSSFPLMMEYTHRMMRMASGGFLSVCVSSRMHPSLSPSPSPSRSLSLSIGMFGGNAQALFQCFRYCSVLQNFKTILMFACAIRPHSSFVNSRCNITGGIVTKSQASDFDV